MKGNILEYIPQRSPLVMIDRLINASESSATTQLNIAGENIFVESQQLAEPGLIENIAQTAAAMVGYQSKLNNTPVPIGFIAAVKDWKLNRLPKVDTLIETTIQVVNTVGEFSIVIGKVRQDDQELCSCEMRILVQKKSQ